MKKIILSTAILCTLSISGALADATLRYMKAPEEKSTNHLVKWCDAQDCQGKFGIIQYPKHFIIKTLPQTLYFFYLGSSTSNATRCPTNFIFTEDKIYDMNVTGSSEDCTITITE
jgi:hypothetical protein